MPNTCKSPGEPHSCLTRLHPVRSRALWRGGSLTAPAGCLDDLQVRGRVISSDVGVDGFLYQAFLQLGMGQLTPYSRLIASLRKFISSVQVSNVLNQDLWVTGRFPFSATPSQLQGEDGFLLSFKFCLKLHDHSVPYNWTLSISQMNGWR